jgi:hypothetical protein
MTETGTVHKGQANRPVPSGPNSVPKPPDPATTTFPLPPPRTNPQQRAVLAAGSRPGSLNNQRSTITSTPRADHTPANAAHGPKLSRNP